MLTWALGAEDPVILLEPKALYRTQAPHAGGAFAPGRARQLRDGADAVLVTWGACVPAALEAARQAEALELDVGVLDMMSLAPLDEEALLTALDDCGRVVVVHDGPRTGGPGAEIAAILAERGIERLEAPVLRVTGPDVPVGYGRDDLHRPDSLRVLRAIEQVVDF